MRIHSPYEPAPDPVLQDMADPDSADDRAEWLRLPTAAGLRIHNLSSLQLADRLRLQRALWRGPQGGPETGRRAALFGMPGQRAVVVREDLVLGEDAPDFDNLENLLKLLQSALQRGLLGSSAADAAAALHTSEEALGSAAAGLFQLAQCSQASNASAARYAVVAARFNDLVNRVRMLRAAGVALPQPATQRTLRAAQHLCTELGPLRSEVQRATRQAGSHAHADAAQEVLALRHHGRSISSPFAAHHLELDGPCCSNALKLRYLLPVATRDARAARMDKTLVQFGALALCRGRYARGHT